MNAPSASAAQTVKLDITGMTCAGCASRLEKTLQATEGVVKATVNFALEMAEVEHLPQVAANDLVDVVSTAGFEAKERRDEAEAAKKAFEEREAHSDAEERKTFQLFALSTLLAIPLVIPMVLMAFGVQFELSGVLQFALATPIQLFVGARFYKGAFAALRHGGANMDVLVSLGTSAAYLYSVYNVFFATQAQATDLYFEASAVILTLILMGKYLEIRAKRSTSAAVRSLIALRPTTANKIVGDKIIPVGISDLRLGDYIVIKPGECVPTDGLIEEGESELDESMLTGENLPVHKNKGDQVTGGTINGAGAIFVRTTALGESTRLAQIIRLVEGAQASKAPLQKLVDKVAAIFVPVIVLIALATFAGWMLYSGDVTTAVSASVAVLVIACPCALGLATPTALVAGTGAAAKAGILIRDIEALERAHKVDTILFDKTGTLTVGKPVLTDAQAFDRNDDRLLTIAASIQLGSEHPLASALIRAAEERNLKLTRPRSIKAIPGKGLIAELTGQQVSIGNAALMKDLNVAPSMMGDGLVKTYESSGKTAVTVALGDRAIGVLAFVDQARDSAREAVESLKKQGIRTVMITGDTELAAKNIADQVGVDEFQARVHPEGKNEVVNDLKEQGYRVAMVGDGINDAPALAAADLGIAMGSGADVALETAGVTLMRSEPKMIPAALDISKATLRKIRQNLFWAFIYNIIGIPLAALGLLSPVIAGAAMAMSSVSVVTNAMLLRRWKPKNMN
ncbi:MULTISPECIES: heavy metal translocating P-type ATPase [unclassified Pseudovibrio]|uniref:heavy metal translocating P-type ATPase n=1 Tax=unclassified Pseudovibrio TaxID=2627060 RepID=UPI0007AED222|nr:MULTISPECIES: heavy metal translocating P-type ATPase [unclassified Pseudovibrio]KZK93030.1 Copper-exporting P-type ATPase A [Pseudovibrio sp. W74]KZL04396.1 Copper-exporting P-type ATPase A [Pseudovibrio sp. Ad14]